MITRAERMKARKKMYLHAFGPLKLSREDLWTITNGELYDMIAAYRFRLFCEREEQAIHTTAILNMLSKNKISVQDFTGIWNDGRILSKEEFFEEWKTEYKKRKEARIKNGRIRRKIKSNDWSKHKRN